MAVAQDVDVASDEGTVEEADPEVMDVWGDDHQWTYGRLRREIVSVADAGEGRLLALASDGTVYLRRGLQGWDVVFTLGTDVEDEADAEMLLLEMEASFEDVLTDPDTEEGSDDESDEVGPGAADTDLDVLDMGIQLMDLADVEDFERPRPAGFVWATNSADGPWLVSWSGSTWVSEDQGRNWEEILGVSQVNAVGELDEGLWLGTDSGLWTLDIDGVWGYDDDILANRIVLSLASDTEALWAGTNEGLYVREFAEERWRPASSDVLAERQIRSILVDDSWDGGLWIATDEGIYRTDDRANTVRLSGRNPLSSTVELIALDIPGHLVAVGNGAWESADGGVRWTSISVGLSGPEQWSGVRDSEGLWIAGGGGVARLGRPVASSERVRVVDTSTLPPVNDLIDRALSRPGLDHTALQFQRSIARALLAPHLSMTGVVARDRTMDADFGALTNSRTDDVAWEISVRLCYGRCGASTQSMMTDPLAMGDLDLLAELEDLDVAVVGNEVYVMENASGYSAVAANVSDRASRYRRSVADAVTDLYFARIRLVQEQSTSANRPLQEQVTLMLDIQEVTARLDVYTDGYFSRALAAQ